MKPVRALLAAALFLAPLAALACACSGGGEGAPRPKVGQSSTYVAPPAVDRFSYVSGTSGTYTVPAGYHVVSWWAHNTTGGGSVTIAPTAPRMFSTCAGHDAGPDAADSAPPSTCRATGSAIVIPAGTSFGLSTPVLSAGSDELADGTIFVFTSTDSYVITLAPH